MTKKGIAILLFITAAYMIAAFVNLGNLKSPQTFYNAGALEPIYIDLGSAHEFDLISIYFGLNKMVRDTDVHAQIEEDANAPAFLPKSPTNSSNPRPEGLLERLTS